MKAEKIWPQYTRMFNVWSDGIIDSLTGFAKGMYKSCEQAPFYKFVTKEEFVEGLVGNFLIDLLLKYKEDHPDFCRGAFVIDDKKLYELGLLDPAIIADETLKKGEVQ
jgi:hypothetical protein